MTYRNDHDAAVARVDALTSENKSLAAENARLREGMTIVRPPAPRTVHRAVAATVLSALLGTAALATYVLQAPAHRSPASRDDSSEPIVIRFDKSALRACERLLDVAPADANATATDPRSSHPSGIGAVQRSTGCRDQIDDVLTVAVLSTEERAALERWSAAEATLDASVSMIGEYYAHDPYALDGYSTAPQLWTEYNRTLVIRNHTLEEWRNASRSDTPRIGASP
jgi:hypothetical protein